MKDLDGRQISGQYEGFRNIQYIPLVIRYATGIPAIIANPANEPITLTDNGVGDVSITLANPSLAPLIVIGLPRSTAAGTLGNNVNILGATTTTLVRLLVNSDADGATEVDPVDLHVLLIKTVQGT